MHVSRRGVIGLLGATAVAATAKSAAAQTTADYVAALRTVLGGRWEGIASTPSSAFEGGEFRFHVSYRFDVGDDLSLSGDYRITTQLDGDVYHGTYAITGRALGRKDDIAFEIASTAFLSGDPLPSTLFWQGMTGTLAFFKDSGDPSNYLLDGTLYGERDSVPFHVQISYK